MPFTLGSEYIDRDATRKDVTDVLLYHANMGSKKPCSQWFTIEPELLDGHLNLMDDLGLDSLDVVQALVDLNLEFDVSLLFVSGIYRALGLEKHLFPTLREPAHA